MNMQRLHWSLVWLLSMLLGAAAAWAQDAAGGNAGPDSEVAALTAALQRGPATIALGDQATLKLPQGYAFLPTREASSLMMAMGNQVDDNFIGLVVPANFVDDDAEEWMVSIDFDPAGYIKDEDAKSWNADELLQNLKDGTEAANAEREKAGVTPIEVTRWIEPPAYDATTQRLVWSVEGHDKGAPPNADNTINYNTYVLGREGYMSLNLITSSSKIEGQKPIARTLLGGVAFNDGKRYDQYDATTDKLASYGLAALVGGVAAKKLGLLAVLAALAAKSFKLIIVGVVAVGAAIRKLFARKA